MPDLNLKNDFDPVLAVALEDRMAASLDVAAKPAAQAAFMDAAQFELRTLSAHLANDAQAKAFANVLAMAVTAAVQLDLAGAPKADNVNDPQPDPSARANVTPINAKRRFTNPALKL